MPGLPTIGPFELLLVLILALLILGPGKLPEVGQALGKTIREFRRASTDVNGALSPNEPTPAQPAPAEPADRPAARPADELPDRTDRQEPRASGR
jgi:sec-independent protein translocase protein TatA